MRVRFHNLFLRLALWLLQFRERPPRFRKWIELEEHKNKIIQAVADNGDLPKHFFAYLSTALAIPVKYFEHADWELIVKSFYQTLQLTQCQLSLPILQPTDKKHPDEPWTYDQRVWHLYSHMLAKTYGWSLEYIANLTVQDAMPKIQEILLDDQLDKEFQWQTSENSISYDQQGKGKFNPLDRPEWMRKRVILKTAPKERTALPANLIPQGVITYEEFTKTQTPNIQ